LIKIKDNIYNNNVLGTTTTSDFFHTHTTSRHTYNTDMPGWGVSGDIGFVDNFTDPVSSLIGHNLIDNELLSGVRRDNVWELVYDFNSI